MAFSVKDRVKETSTSTGTEDFTLAGADQGFQSFSVIGDGNTTYYVITDGADFEVGLGTYTASGTTLSRDTVLESSNSGALVNFGAGLKQVFATYPAEKAVFTDADQTLSEKTIYAKDGDAANPSVAFTDDTDTGLFSAAANELGLSTSGNERIRIDSNGNVGINTSSPSEILEVNGRARFNADILSLGNYRLNKAGGTLLYSTDGGDDIELRANNSSSSTTTELTLRVRGANDRIRMVTADVERLRIDSNGRVGIGTTVGFEGSLTMSDYALIRRNTDGWLLKHERTDNSQECGLKSVSHPGAVGLSFVTNDTERMRVDTSGTLLVGKTVSNDTTEGTRIVSGGLLSVVRDGNVSLILNRNTSDGATAFFRRSGTTVGSISVTGTTTTYNTSSDYRLKEIDGPITKSGDYIDALKPVQGSWKADGSRFIGLLAHEVQEVSETTIATGEKDGEEMQSMDYSSSEIIANLIAEVQSLRSRLAKLEGN